MNRLVNKYLINSLFKYIGIDKGKSLDQVDSYLEGHYRNVLVIIADNIELDSIDKNSFIKKGHVIECDSYNSCDLYDIKTIVKEINTKTEYSCYGIENSSFDMHNFVRQAANLTSINSSKYIFSYIDDVSSNLFNKGVKNLARCVKDTLIIISFSNFSKIVLIDRISDKVNYIIRKPEVSDFLELKAILFPHHDNTISMRGDLFSYGSIYTLNEFSNLCKEVGNEKAFVYEEGNEILGFVEIKIKNYGREDRKKTDDNIVVVDKIIVREDARGRGIATILYKQVEKYAKRIRADRLEFNLYYFDKVAFEFIKSLDLQIQKIRYEKKLK